ncbi:MAG: type II toxin-antitoxin system RelE/ParE family toxin [Candidatus Hydrogenedentes bacterium]|nr:type II toxin-antitoxin system RelE/ParE family toxin [Candidatus Hydrogenedentota bacterium]
MAQIRWTVQATADLESITEFIARDSGHYARVFAIDVVHAVERLTQFPNSGRVVPEVNDPMVREILLGAYRIVYRLRGDYADILTIHHGARLLDPADLR